MLKTQVQAHLARRGAASAAWQASSTAIPPSSVATSSAEPPPAGAGSGAQAMSMTRPTRAAAATVTGPCGEIGHRLTKKMDTLIDEENGLAD